MDDYEEYAAECKKIKAENEKILNGFENYLSLKKLSFATIRKHTGNISFFINEFLLYEEPLRPNEGVSSIDYFLGSWFISKAMWSSVTAIKENISSLKHFYTYLHSIGALSTEDLSEFKNDIKEGKESWLETMDQYDNTDTNF
jgi:hypothetical protein